MESIAGQSEPFLDADELRDFLLDVAIKAPVFIWGPPGIGKSAIVESFAGEIGLPCVSLLGSQLAPEDLMGSTQVADGRTQFCPPKVIARDHPYCLFLDEFNICAPEVQKAFYSLIHDRRVGDYKLLPGSMVICAGNRRQDVSITHSLSSALINRLIHVHMKVSPEIWLKWAEDNGIHFLILEYIRAHPDHLCVDPNAVQKPYSTPRAWHLLSDSLHTMAQRPSKGKTLAKTKIEALAYGCLSLDHAATFNREVVSRFIEQQTIFTIMNGEAKWPKENKELLKFLAQAFRGHLIDEMPEFQLSMTGKQVQLLNLSKDLLKDLFETDANMAQIVLVKQNRFQKVLPEWLVDELAEEFPQLQIDKNS